MKRLLIDLRNHFDKFGDISYKNHTCLEFFKRNYFLEITYLQNQIANIQELLFRWQFETDTPAKNEAGDQKDSNNNFLHWAWSIESTASHGKPFFGKEHKNI